jgi:4-amino-4-deoxy-L-arabinose transferase-like glycosyltransferase
MARHIQAPWALTLFLVHVCVWSAYGALAHTGSVHPDMLEAYLWGHEFQLGYFKHPPFWAWIAGAWFEVFPRANWAFYLLCSLNSGLAILGVWRLYGLYTGAQARRAGVLLLFATPFYTFLCFNFNANTILLSVWPWTVYFFARSIERLNLRYAALFGACAAAALLSKYYSALLLASCAIASFLHPNTRNYYRSFAPYFSVLVAALLFAPHAVWLVQNDFIPFEYAETRTAFSDGKTYLSILTFFLGCIGFHALMVGLALFARWRGGVSEARVFDRVRAPFLLALAFGPFALTILAGLVGHVRISTNFATGIFILVPLILMHVLRPDIPRLQLFASRFRLGLYAAALPVAFTAPFVLALQEKATATEPYLEAAAEAQRVWKETTPAPLRTVGGALPQSAMVAFYGKGEIKEFTNLNPRHAPWITKERLAETGLLVICSVSDAKCRDAAQAYASPEARETEVTVSRRVGKLETSQRLAFTVIPPAGGAAHEEASARPLAASAIAGGL